VPPIARVKSRIPGGSTYFDYVGALIARIIVAIGPERFCVTSMTRMPLNGPVGDAAMISFLF
jgi:hypothetical protein